MQSDPRRSDMGLKEHLASQHVVTIGKRLKVAAVPMLPASARLRLSLIGLW